MLIKVIYFLLFLSTYSQVEKQLLDSLYFEGNYKNFLNQNLQYLKENKAYRDDLKNTLKIANAFYKNEKFEKSLRVYSMLLERDSLLRDYYKYYIIQSFLHLKDTTNYLKEIQSYFNDYSEDYYLSKELLNNTEYLDIIKRKKDKSTISNREILKEDSLYQSYQHYLDTLRRDLRFSPQYHNKRILYRIFKTEIKRKRLSVIDKLLPVYDSISHFDKYSKSLIEYYTLKRNYRKALEIVRSRVKEKLPYKLRIDYHRRIPRLYLKLKKINKAYDAYLNFARLFPNHSFSISAVTYVLGKVYRVNRKKYLAILKEFSNIKSVYRNYYRFQEILYYYEKKNYKNAHKIIDNYLTKKLSYKFNDKLKYWKAKILFEENQYDKAIRILEEFKKNPFHSYYSLKAMIALNENKKLSLDSLHIDDHSTNLDSISFDHSVFAKDETVNRLSLIFNTYGYKYTRNEIDYYELYKRLDIDSPVLIKLYEDLEQYDLAIRLRHRYSSKNKVSSFVKAHIKYPQYFDNLLKSANGSKEIEKELILAIMYRESLFQRDAVSKSNAHGLMQIIPETAQNISRRYSIIYNEIEDLYEPETNIKIGTRYLSWLLKKFDNVFEYVLSAYNAGPGRVNRWKKKYPIKNADLYIEKIEFEQTRTYVKKVLYHYYAYKILNNSYKNFYYSGVKSR